MTDNEVLTLAVPETLAALYLVPTSDPPADPVALACEGLATVCGPGPAEFAQHLLAAGHAEIEVRPAESVPPLAMEMFDALGATGEQLRKLAAASHFVIVMAGYGSGWPPGHEWAARALAATLAQALHTDVVDPRTPQMLDAARLARTLPDDTGEVRLADWIFITHSPATFGHWCTTGGLRVFGLPELQTLVVPPQLVQPWAAIMTGMSRRLLGTWCDSLDLHRSTAFLEMSSLLRVTNTDVAAAYGDPPPAQEADVVVRLTFDPETEPGFDSFLTIEPPLEWAGSSGEFIAAACATLFGAPRDEIRHTRRTDALVRATAAARTSLPRIRMRFEEGALGLVEKLMVKFAIDEGDQREYVWAYVTSWHDPARLLASSANDALSDARVRIGRPVVVDADTIIDWAVVVDGQGVVEGGFTEAALDEATEHRHLR